MSDGWRQTHSVTMRHPKAQPAPDLVVVAHDVGGIGGMETQLGELVPRFAAQGIRVTVVARTCALSSDDNINFVRIRTPGRPFLIAYPAFALAASWRVRRLKRKYPAAVIHANGALVMAYSHVVAVHYCHAGATTAAASRASGKPWIKRPYYRIAATVSRAAERFLYRQQMSGLLCPVSPGVEPELRRAFPAMASRIRTIPNGVDTQRFRPNPQLRRISRRRFGVGDGELCVAFVGGDWERKGLRYAVDALTYASRWSLLVAGSGNRNTFDKLDLTNRIHWLGPVTDPEAVYAAADAFVLPSSYETFSMVTFEAAASGLPLLVTRVSGPDDLIQEGKNGWFITQSGKDIASRLDQLSSSRTRRARLGDSARASVESFSWDAAAEMYISAYVEAGMPAPPGDRPKPTI